MLASDMVDRLARIESKLDDVSDRVARMEGRAEAETTGVRRSPLVEDGPRGWDRLAAWVALWAPWQVLLAIGMLVGGPTVAGPTVERMLSAVMPALHAIETPPAKPPKPADGNDDAAGILDTVTDTADDLATPRPLP